MTNTSRSTIKSTRTTFSIIRCIQHLDGANVTEIADYLNLSKSSVYKYVKTLEEERYVVKDENNECYLGLRFLSHGVDARRRKRIYEVSKPQITKLAQQSNETASLVVEEYGRGIFLDHRDSNQAVDIDTHAGREMYLHTTAMGKAILAHLPSTRVNEIIEQHGLPRTTANTITDRDALSAELKEITNLGWAYDDEERLRGLCCIGAAILGPDEKPIGAIGVSGPSSHMNRSRCTDELAEMIQQAKDVIELHMTYS